MFCVFLYETYLYTEYTHERTYEREREKKNNFNLFLLLISALVKGMTYQIVKKPNCEIRELLRCHVALEWNKKRRDWRKSI